MFDTNTWPHPAWWERKETYARLLSDAELRYARQDAGEAARRLRGFPEEGKYLDEASIYATEQKRRHIQ